MNVSGYVSAQHNPSIFEPLVGAGVYLITVFMLKKLCKTRRDLTPVAVVHNLILIALSLAMGTGGILALHSRYQEEGFDGIFCSQRGPGKVLDGAAGFWTWVFYYSKFYELGDTMLLCLKLKPTIPLHLYHHVVMLFLCWSWVRYDWLEGSVWCVIVNSIIHTFMYTYYLMTAIGKDVWWKKFLTGAQIFQFLTGTGYVCIYMYQHYTRVGGCGSPERIWAAWAAHFVNVTFIFLFAQFFVKSYLSKGKSRGGRKNA